ncbi:tetratricopeptide repeat protein [bacterium]|nr:tetratricopeptide repeat protein [bacterium]
MKRLSFTIALCVISVIAQAQVNLDSLWGVWNDTAQDDTCRLRAISTFSFDGYVNSQPDSAFYFSQLQYELAEKSGHKGWMANALSTQGVSFIERSDYEKAREYLNRSLLLSKEIGDEERIEEAQVNLGKIFWRQGDFEQAMASYSQSLALVEKRGDRKKTARLLYNVGTIAFQQGNLPHALELLSRSEKLCEEVGDQRTLTKVYNVKGLIYLGQEELDKALEYFSQYEKIREEMGRTSAGALTNIGVVHQRRGDTTKAIEYFTRSLKIFEEKGAKRDIAGVLGLLGDLYFDQGNYKQALANHRESLRIREEIGDKYGIANSLASLAKEDLRLGRHAHAQSDLNRSLRLAQEIGHIELIQATAQNLVTTYKETGQYQQAMGMYELFIEMRDSIQNEENTKVLLRNELQTDFDKQKALDDLENEKQLEIEKEKQEKQQLLSAAIGIGLLLVLLLALGLWNRNRFINKSNTELGIAKDRAVQSELYKEQFLANITHEFRTPLTVIMGMTEEFEKTPEEAKKMIFRNSENLLSLINQLLDLSKLESGKLEMKWVQGNVVPYLHYLSESFQSFAETKDIQLLFYQEVEELVMDYDEEKLQQIVSNLVSNAIKFTPQKGKVKVHVNARHENGKEELILKVKDTGMGIEQATLPHIFDRFYQVGDSHTYKGEGTGIGLALAKELVEMMGGNISVTSEIGNGTEFTIVLPVSREAGPKPIEMPLSRKAMMQAEKAHPSFPLIEKALAANQVLPDSELPFLLIIEDNPDVATYIETCLEGLYRIEKAENGQVGIDKAIERVPDIIISDVMMPVKDGFEVCNIVKNDERTSHIPIVLLTAKASVQDRLTGLQRGADAYLTKPFNKKELFIRLEKLIELRQQLQKRYNGAALFDPSPTTEVPLEIEDAFLVKLKTILEKHLDDADYSIPDFCKETGMSRTQLHRKLKALTDKSATHFIRSFRLRKAKELLQTTDLNVSEIAYDVGFRDHAYFSTRFLEEFGISPSETRK